MTGLKTSLVVAVAVVALNLTACSSLPKLSTGDGKAVQVAVDGYHVVEKAATVYGNLPECQPGQTYLKNMCANRAVVMKLITYGRVANEAKNQLVSFARANPTSSTTQSYITALTSTVSVLKKALSSEGVTF